MIIYRYPPPEGGNDEENKRIASKSVVNGRVIIIVPPPAPISSAPLPSLLAQLEDLILGGGLCQPLLNIFRVQAGRWWYIIRDPCATSAAAPFLGVFQVRGELGSSWGQRRLDLFSRAP